MNIGCKFFVFTSLVICLRIYGTGAILCYQCADTTDNRERASCQYGVRQLMAQRSLHQIEGEPLKNLNRLKNCSHYLDDRGEYVYQYCKIERIRAHGVTNAFIRDCSDGRTFGINITRLQLARPDNQTICGFSQLHLANVCVSICTGDFCNGPFSSTEQLTTASVFVLLATVLVGVWCKL